MNTLEDGSAPCLLHAYSLDNLEAIEANNICFELERESLTWAHLDAHHPDARNWLGRHVPDLDQLIVDALLATETRPRMVEHNHGLLVILRGVNLNLGHEPEDMVSVRIWIDSKRIISAQLRKLYAVSDVVESIENQSGPKTAGDFLVLLAKRLFERMEPSLNELNDQLDDIEERVMLNPSVEERQDVIDIRKQAIEYRRYIAPQRDIMAQLCDSVSTSWISKNHERQIHECHDRLLRYIENLDSVRERAQIVKDELSNALSDRLNRNLYLLSVITTIFLPLGFLTGLFGINIGGMPGVDNPHAFWLFTGILIAIIIAQILFFRGLRWLRS